MGNWGVGIVVQFQVAPPRQIESPAESMLCGIFVFKVDGFVDGFTNLRILLGHSPLFGNDCIVLIQYT